MERTLNMWKRGRICGNKVEYVDKKSNMWNHVEREYVQMVSSIVQVPNLSQI